MSPETAIVTKPEEIQERRVELKFTEPQLDMITSTAQFNLMHCGVGSGKTYVIGARNAIYAKLYPHVRGFIGANTYNQLSKSTLVGVFKFWAEIGLVKDRDYVVGIKPPQHYTIIGPPLESYKNTISFVNGKLIFLASLDNYQTIDGMEFAHADLDETKDTKEEAVREVVTARLRQKGLWLDKRGRIITDEAQAIREDLTGFTPLNIHTSPAKTDWLSDWFNLPAYYDEISEVIFNKDNYFRKLSGNYLVVIASTYHNEHNLPKGYIEDKLIEPNRHNKHRINMLVYGSPIGKVGNEYYGSYDRLEHVKERECPSNVAVHFSFDFNRKPYITLGCYKTWYTKVDEVWDVHKFAEVCLPPPYNTTEHLCDAAITRFEPILHNGLFIYGDYSGKNRRTNSMEDDYDVIFRKFARYIGDRQLSNKTLSDRVATNKPVVKRKEHMNRIFYGSLPIRFTISPKCINTIKDCDFLQEAPDGGKIKPKDKDQNEKYGHCSDEMEYFFTSCFHQYFKLK